MTVFRHFVSAAFPDTMAATRSSAPDAYPGAGERRSSQRCQSLHRLEIAGLVLNTTLIGCGIPRQENEDTLFTRVETGLDSLAIRLEVSRAVPLGDTVHFRLAITNLTDRVLVLRPTDGELAPLYGVTDAGGNAVYTTANALINAPEDMSLGPRATLTRYALWNTRVSFVTNLAAGTYYAYAVLWFEPPVGDYRTPKVAFMLAARSE